MRQITAIFLMLVTSITAATAGDHDTLPDGRQWASAVNAGDTATLASLYAGDAVLVAPSLEIISRPQAIARYLLSKDQGQPSGMQVEVINSRLDGDTLYQSAVWVASVTRNGITSSIDGELNNVYARQNDGTWKIKIQNWN